MACVMTKRGNMDNVVTYEFICDTVSDMNAIDNTERLLGSVAIVLAGDSGGLEVYIANSSKQWVLMSGMGGGSASSGAAAGLSLYICGANEYNSSTKVPTISNPDETTLYLVPASQESGNLYDEYVYVDGVWEKFGGGRIDLSNYATLNDISSFYTKPAGGIPATDLAETYLTAHQDISGKANSADLAAVATSGSYNDLNNTPNLSQFAPKSSPVFQNSISLGRKANTTVGAYSSAIGNNVQASGQITHAEGSNTTASGNSAHAEGYFTTSQGISSHTEGYYTTASGKGAHAEGYYATASQLGAHAEGSYTQAFGENQHVSGRYNYVDDLSEISYWHANTEYHVGDKAKYQEGWDPYKAYICIQANTDSTFDRTKWQLITEIHAEIIGNGTANNLSNARALDWNGNEHLKGDIYINCNVDSTGGTALGAYIAALVTRIETLEAEVAALKVPAAAVTMENGEPLTDEQGNYIEYDQPTT